MKIFYFLLLTFLFSDTCFSQDSSSYIFHLSKLLPQGILLDKGWKFSRNEIDIEDTGNATSVKLC